MAMGDFETQKRNLQEKIDSAEQEGEITADFSEFESLKQQMVDLETRKSTFEEVSDKAEQGPTGNDEKQVEGLGGSADVLDEKLKENKEEVKETEEVVGAAEVKMANADIDHKVNPSLESGAPNEVPSGPDLSPIEKWNKDLVEKIDRLNNNIKTGNEEATNWRNKANEATDAESKKMYRDSMIFWDSWTDARRRELNEAERQLKKNQSEMQTPAV